MKIIKLISFLLLLFLLLSIIIVFEYKEWKIGDTLSGIIIGFVLPSFFKSIQDIFDNTNWKMAQRKLERASIINKNTLIRISFAYLYRIKVEDKYLLVKNERGTKKYQPVGGVYKFDEQEKLVLKYHFQVKDDNKISIDESSHNDYRLRMENKFLRKFVSRFDKKAKRENINNLSREFKEELIEKNILNWKHIKYRFCGRYISNIQFSNHFQTYELLLADIVELLPTKEQENDLKLLVNKKTNLYRLVTAEEIMSLGINTEKGQLEEKIADHSTNILQENEGKLMKILDVSKTYEVNI